MCVLQVNHMIDNCGTVTSWFDMLARFRDQLEDMALSVYDSRNSSCEQNVSTEAVKLEALMIGAPGIACFGLNL